MANWATRELLGDPSTKEWQSKMLKEIQAGNGHKWRVLGPAAPAFQGLLADLEAAGYNPQSSGGFNYRTIRGSNKLSQHAFGNSIDINAATNPMLNGKLQTDMPASIGEIAAKHNLEWGGNWKRRPDPMHFEWKGGDVSQFLKEAGIQPLLGNGNGVGNAPTRFNIGMGGGNFDVNGPVGAEAAALPTAAVSSMQPDNFQASAAPVAEASKGLMDNKDFTGGLDMLAKAFGGGNKNQQQQEQLQPVSNYSSEQAARAQSAQALMAQLMASKKNLRGMLG